MQRVIGEREHDTSDPMRQNKCENKPMYEMVGYRGNG